VCLALMLLAGASAGLAQSGDEPISLAEYQARLDATVERLREPGELDDPAVLALLDEGVSVRLPDGEVVRTMPLQPDGGERFRALERAATVQEQVALSGKDRTVERLARLDAVLARPEFVRSWIMWLDPRPLLERLWEWLRGLLPEPPSVPAGAGAGVAADGVAWAMAGLIAVALALLLSYWLTRLLGGFARDAEVRPSGASERPATAAAARREATAHAQAGRFREAVRALYLSALLRLEERGVVRADRSLTNREYLAHVGGERGDEIRQRLQPVVQTFDDVWYGVHEPDRDTFARYQDSIDRLNEVVP
jgi:hypothetical protein